MTKHNLYPITDTPRHGRVGRKLTGLLNSGVERMTASSVGSVAHIKEVVSALHHAGDNHGVLGKGEKLSTRLDTRGIASSGTSESRKHLSHMLVTGDTVTGVVVSSEKEGGYFKVKEASVVTLPFGINKLRAEGGTNQSPLDVIATVDIEKLPEQMEHGALKPWTEVLIGRQETKGAVDDKMSRHHAVLDFGAAGHLDIVDQNSTNGTYVLDHNSVGSGFGLQGVDAENLHRLYGTLQRNPSLWDPDLAGKHVVHPHPID